MKKFLPGTLCLGLICGASGATYYSFNSVENGDLFKEIIDIYQKISNLVKKIEDKIETHSQKEDLEKIWAQSTNLTIIKDFTSINDEDVNQKQLLEKEKKESEAEIQKLKEKIKSEGKDDDQIKEIYQKIEVSSSWMSEISKKLVKLTEKIKALNENITRAETAINKKVNRNHLEELENLNSQIETDESTILDEKLSQKDLQVIKTLEEKISKTKKKIEEKLKDGNFKDVKEEVNKFLNLNIEMKKWSYLSGKLHENIVEFFTNLNESKWSLTFLNKTISKN